MPRRVDVAKNLEVAIRAIRPGQERAAAYVAVRLHSVVRALISRPGRSEPGQPPGLETGGLYLSYRYDIVRSRAGVEAVVASDESTIRPGTDQLVTYAKHLEFGTEDIEPRPHLRVAVAIVMPEIPRIHARQIEIEQRRALRRRR